jgi:hypothetical protein
MWLSVEEKLLGYSVAKGGESSGDGNGVSENPIDKAWAAVALLRRHFTCAHQRRCATDKLVQRVRSLAPGAVREKMMSIRHEGVGIVA